jgi:hypothetical protein
MKYGWTAQQMARVNARRETRGQKSLSQGAVNEKYSQDYNEYLQQYSRRRRKGIEEEDGGAQVVSKTPRLEEYKTIQGERVAAATPRLDEYKKRLRQREMEKSGGYLSSPYETEMGSLA